MNSDRTQNISVCTNKAYHFSHCKD